ncbi:hypothetical protein SAMN06265795_12229 [Noviherbaspirillum humi]|uniref:Phage antitermination protein Q n=1 Tax=Noviherbaspirillum humi TaxID=1688639 RepID=A0A239LDR7_9BURK|nr:antiterminator Q family protein [Noviherbaspirillum humi]SNT28786.1 hypothetical protein SAMN06265795_12229 [Noviherbaspirillum humi]
MIEWVHVRLERWGEWASGRQRIGGCGISSAYQLVHARSTATPDPLAHGEEMEIDAALAAIKLRRPQLYDVAYARYVQCLSNLTIAGRTHCHVDTVYNRLNALHKLIDKHITERRARAVRRAA